MVIVYFKKDAPEDAPGPPAAMRVSADEIVAELEAVGFRAMRLETELLVREDAVSRFSSLSEELEKTLRRVRAEGEPSFAWLATDLNPQGVTGDATLGTPELGKRLVGHYARVLADVILDAREFPIERLTG